MCVCKNRNRGGKIPPSEGLEGFDSEPSAGFAWERHGVRLKGCVFWGDCGAHLSIAAIVRGPGKRRRV